MAQAGRWWVGLVLYGLVRAWASSTLSIITMAGGAIKGEAWSPSGGWFFVPKNWKPNTYLALGGLAVAGALSVVVGSKLQYQSNTAETDETIAKWNAAAAKARQASAVKETQGSE